MVTRQGGCQEARGNDAIRSKGADVNVTPFSREIQNHAVVEGNRVIGPYPMWDTGMLYTIGKLFKFVG